MNNPRRSPLIVAYLGVLFAEAGMLIVATVFLVVEVLVASADSLTSAIALTVLTALASAWLVVIAVQSVAGFAWTRSAAIVWQILQLAIAVGSFQGMFAEPGIGWILLLLSLVALVLAFSRPVIDATSNRPDRR